MSNLNISPGPSTLTAAGQTVQFRATATLQTGSAPSTTEDVTNSVTWSSSNPGAATVSKSGLATAVSLGSTTIMAEKDGQIASTELTVSIPVVAPPTPVPPSLTIYPGSNQSPLVNIGETVQFIAIGSLDGSGTPQDLTNHVKWSSSDVSVATIDQAGLATAVSLANTKTTIVALGTTPDGAVVSAASNISVSSSPGTPRLSTLALYKVGLGANWQVTSSPIFLNCGSALDQASCTGNFVVGATVTLTAVPGAGTSFGGWSANCAPASSGPRDAVSGQPLTCTLKMPGYVNDTVGVIFNPVP